MSVRTVTVDGLDVLVAGEPGALTVEPETSDRPAALWTQQVIAGGNIHAVVRNIDPETSFDDIHRIAERVAGELGIGAADVAFAIGEGSV